MLYPVEKIEEKLGFDKIRQWLHERCLSVLGKQYVEKMRFSDNYELIDKLTRQTAEFKYIIESGEVFPQQNYLHILPYLDKASIEGTFLEAQDFWELYLAFKTITDCLQFFEKKEENTFPLLKELSSQVNFDTTIAQQIANIIDERGQIRDNASPELSRLRKSINQNQNHLRNELDRILKQAKQQGYVKDEASLTIREGRMVIPVAAEHKRKIKGFVHDESATGQTVFLEPAEILDLNNEIRELIYRERHEVIRILTQLTETLRPHIHPLRKAAYFLGMIDFIRAKARLAIDLKAINPVFERKNQLKWIQARHPLLYFNFKSQAREVVPLSITIDEKQRIILISGPNAGGKSVALKTIGLLQYMYQCGILVPLHEDSTMGFFRDIFIDMGDEQSIENDLSTYSSHLTSMRFFLQKADEKTLFLIDEFGTGTEPTMGAAIAEVILEKLHQANAKGIITTHYNSLKVYADNTSNICNAAMRFDTENLEPLYQLEVGKPGSSFAFEIAQKIGLPKEIIQKSRQRAGNQQVDFDKILKELEVQKKFYDLKNKEVKEKEIHLQKITEEYEQLKNFLDKEKKKLLNQAKTEAQNIVQKAKQKIEQTIKEIKENEAEKQKTKEIRRNLDNFAAEELKTETIEEESNTEAEEFEIVGGEIKEGDFVRIIGQETIGQVINIKGKDAEIGIGDLKSTLKISRLEKVNRKTIRQIQHTKSYLKGVDMNEKMMQFSYRLDIRGMRGEEALKAVEQLTDDAILLAQAEIYIVHGKGDGILRKLIRDYLQKIPAVATLQDEHADRGGAGVTIVRFKN
ncbi:MAG: endonuclease MutS2 [Cytophagales bacterium]|nr:MAG: endonuclease MutS2 [Cytophagales bacterium]